jgi:methyl-accepting chemotaxis protein
MKEKVQSLRARFVLTFTAFIVIVCIVISLAAIRNTAKIASDIFAEQGSYAIQKALELVDGDSFEALVRSQDSSDPFYEETHRKLLELKEFSSCVFLYTMAPVEGTVWQYIIDGSTQPDDKENFSPLGTKEDVSSYDDAFFLSWETGTEHNGKLVKEEGWGWLISTYAVIKNSAGKSVGIAGIDFQAKTLVQLLIKDALTHAIIGVCSVAAGLGILFMFLRIIFNRLNNINSILREISEGEGDLTGRITVHRRDEIGQLAIYFNLTLDKIKNLVVTIKNQTVNLHGVGVELSSNMETTAQAIRRISAHIEDIKTKVMRQSASVNETGATMEQVTQNINNLNDRVTEQAGNVSHSSSAVEEMLANIKNVTQTLMQNADNVRELITASDAGRGGLEAVSRDIQEIARESEGLLEINAVMQNIASQTNLLSMNAAIEAAHAGEAGKGFAVVADEIRKLAENSGKQSKTISAVLKKIKEAIDGITASANAVLERFGAIGEKVRIVSGEETKIRGAMEAQGQGSQELLESIAQLNGITRLVQSGSEEMLTGSRDVIKESKNLETLSNEIAAGMNEMSSGAEQINAAVNRVNEISGANKEHIDSLVMEVSRFKVNA